MAVVKMNGVAQAATQVVRDQVVAHGDVGKHVQRSVLELRDLDMREVRHEEAHRGVV